MDGSHLIKALNLLPHPEGGYYMETYRCGQTFEVSSNTIRNVSTCIYFLLQNHDKSHFHRIQSDELWFFHQGVTLEILMIENGKIKVILLGNDLNAGEVPQAVVPAHTWFASRLKSAKGYALVSCTVAPGFDFKDFEMAQKKSLIEEYPNLKEVIGQMALD